jgi:tetratricopeptide (TPR) repeat protein
MMLPPSSTRRASSSLLVACLCLLCLPPAQALALLTENDGSAAFEYASPESVPDKGSWQEPADGLLFNLLKKLEPSNYVETKRLEKIQSLVEKGEYAEAQQEAELFTKSNPKYGPGYELTGLIFVLQNQLEKAIVAFEKAAALDSKNSAALTKLGSVHMALGQSDKAKQVLLKALARNPNDRLANQRMGLMAEDARDYDKAISYYERGLAGTAAEYVGIKVNLAILYNKKREFAKTIALLGTQLKPENTNVTGHIVLGTAYLYTNQAEEAVKRFKYAAAFDKQRAAVPLAIALRMSGKPQDSKQVLLEAASATPADPLVLFQLGETHRLSGEYPQALQYYRKAIGAGYPQTTALRQVATLHMQQAQYKDAIENLTQIIASKDSVLADRFILGEAYQFNGQFAEAEKLLRTLSEQHPKETAVWHRLGMHYGLVREYSKAIDALQKAKALSPEDLSVLRALAMANFQGGKTDEALVLGEEVFRRQPDSKDSAFFLASLYQGAGKSNEARNGYKNLLQRWPDHAPSLNNLADLTALSGGDIAEAVAMAKRAVAIEPDNGRYLDTLGWLYYQSGNLDDALATLEKAHAVSPKIAIIQFHLGSAYYRKGVKEKARELLQASLQQPDASWENEARRLLELSK